MLPKLVIPKVPEKLFETLPPIDVDVSLEIAEFRKKAYNFSLHPSQEGFVCVYAAALQLGMEVARRYYRAGVDRGSRWAEEHLQTVHYRWLEAAKWMNWTPTDNARWGIPLEDRPNPIADDEPYREFEALLDDVARRADALVRQEARKCNEGVRQSRIEERERQVEHATLRLKQETEGLERVKEEPEPPMDEFDWPCL